MGTALGVGIRTNRSCTSGLRNTSPRAERMGSFVRSTDALSAELASIDFDVTFQAGKLNSVIFVYCRVGEFELVPVISQIFLNQRIGAAPGGAAIYDHDSNSVPSGAFGPASRASGRYPWITPAWPQS